MTSQDGYTNWAGTILISFCHENVISGNQPQFKKIKLEEHKLKIENLYTFYKTS